ncbi:MAG: PKD domain-containing protein [Ardenticatenaceae bacterium]|nr:PKD domain-containing protein [Ardenticatenaceae bacterium]
MKLRWHFIWALLAVAGLAAFWISSRTAAFDPADSFSGQARIDGPLQLELTVSPPIATPGDTLILTVKLHNTVMVTAVPQLTLNLPPGMRPDPARMPAGMTANLQTNALNWLPILPANGGEQQVEVAVRVETADVTQPEKVVTAVLTNETDTQTASAPIWIGIAPQINRILTPPPVAVGQPIQLLAEISGSGPVAQTWHLGDGRRIDVNDPVVAYAAAGSYEITLEVANPLTAQFDSGQTIAKSTMITIVPEPAAQFVPDDDTPGVGQTVKFLNQSGGQQPLVYRWEFGDGSTMTGAEPSHQYTVPGTYTVHLTVENAFGRSEAFWPVTVGAPPIADMEIDDYAAAGQPVQGQAFGDDTVTTFRWDMGDGNVYEGAFVSHPYRAGGDFYVSMTAVNEHGGTEIGRWVHIDPGIMAVYLPLIMRFEETSAGLEGDPYGLVLPPVELDEPFILEPVSLPVGLSPAEQLFFYINEARQQFDLPPLNLIPQLSSAAQQHAADMAGYQYTAHTGSDGSYPAERLLWAGYQQGYAGEATAWGFEHPYQAVEFWVNSPAHRRIILNQYATDVGVGFITDFGAPNVWYWTAEFGNSFTAAAQPFIRLNEPQAGVQFLISEPVTFSWNWPKPLEPGQQFTVYGPDGVIWGQVTAPQLGTRYGLRLPASMDWSWVGSGEWHVALEDAAGAAQLVSESRLITFVGDPDVPTPTPAVTATAVPTIEPTATPIPPTPTPVIPGSTPRPTLLPPPVLITATPAP